MSAVEPATIGLRRPHEILHSLKTYIMCRQWNPLPSASGDHMRYYNHLKHTSCVCSGTRYHRPQETTWDITITQNIHHVSAVEPATIGLWRPHEILQSLKTYIMCLQWNPLPSASGDHMRYYNHLKHTSCVCSGTRYHRPLETTWDITFT